MQIRNRIPKAKLVVLELTVKFQKQSKHYYFNLGLEAKNVYGSLQLRGQQPFPSQLNSQHKLPFIFYYYIFYYPAVQSTERRGEENSRKEKSKETEESDKMRSRQLFDLPSKTLSKVTPAFRFADRFIRVLGDVSQRTNQSIKSPSIIISTSKHILRGTKHAVQHLITNSNNSRSNTTTRH
jgi:hypothetical protein